MKLTVTVNVSIKEPGYSSKDEAVLTFETNNWPDFGRKVDDVIAALTNNCNLKREPEKP